MISESYDLAEFFRSVSFRNSQDLIYNAVQEATGAERHLYRLDRSRNMAACRDYVNALKSLIDYLRYQTRPPVSEHWLVHFQAMETALRQCGAVRKTPSG